MIAAIFKNGTVHLVREHASRPSLENRPRVRALCGRSGTVLTLATRFNLCQDCRMIEKEANSERD